VRGPIKGTLDHLCRVRACAHPWHVEDVTMQVNILRGNGLAAQNARKTHCKNGHLLTERKASGNKERFCRICYRKYDREWKAALRKAGVS